MKEQQTKVSEISEEERTGASEEEKTGVSEEDKNGASEEQKTGASEEEKIGASEDENSGSSDIINIKNSSGKKERSAVPTVLLVILLLAGVAIMLYPTFSDWYNRLHESRAIVNYNRTVNENDTEANEKLWNDAAAYNEKLTVHLLKNGGAADFTLTDAEEKEYESVLDVSGTGIMGYIDVPKQNIHLPVYHGVSESVLQTAVGHLAGSSLPVGGTSTHCVITGHTGLPSAKLFTDIDQMEIGDTFYLTVLDHVLTYEVDDIRTILPSELETLGIEEGKDLCTLVTCTPYGINTHRLLVTGRRVPTPDTDVKPSGSWRSEALEIGWKTVLPFVIAAAAAAALIAVMRRRRKKVRGGDPSREEKDLRQ